MLHARPDYNRIQDPAGLIPEGEPVFLMRGQNTIAAKVTRYWAQCNDEEGGDPKLSQMARDHADLMDKWPKKKVADL